MTSHSAQELSMWELYKARINTVMDYIEAHIDRDFTLDELADKAWDWMCKVWLPTSGYLPDDRLSFELYSMKTIFDTPDKTQQNVEICIPVKPMGS